MDLTVDGAHCLDLTKEIHGLFMENSNGDLDQDNKGPLEETQDTHPLEATQTIGVFAQTTTISSEAAAKVLRQQLSQLLSQKLSELRQSQLESYLSSGVNLVQFSFHSGRFMNGKGFIDLDGLKDYYETKYNLRYGPVHLLSASGILLDLIQAWTEDLELVQREYNIRYNVISVIMILLLPLCCSYGIANNMMHIMMFITVIHLISGDIEINPGPQFNAQDLKKKPEISDLHRIFIKFRAAHRFVTIGVALKVEVNDLIYSPLDIEKKLYLVFDRWIEKNENVTWGKIVEVCDDFELGLVCEAISDFLSRQSKYKREADFDSTGTERTNKDNGYFTKTDVLLLILIVLVCYLICLSWTDCKC